jgi:hypothetical protein
VARDATRPRRDERRGRGTDVGVVRSNVIGFRPGRVAMSDADGV